MKAKNAFFLSIGIILLVASFVVTGVLYFKLKKVSEEKLIVTEETVDSELDADITQTEESLVSATTTPEYSNPKIPTEKLDIDWLSSAQSLSENDTNKLLNKLYPEYSTAQKEYPLLLKQCKKDQNTECPLQDDFKVKLYLVGQIKTSNFPVYIIDVPNLCIYELMYNTIRDLVFYNTTSNSLTRIVTTDDSTVFIPDPKYADIDPQFCKAGGEVKFKSISLFSATIRASFPELTPPQKINLPEQKDGSYLKLVNAKYTGYSSWQNIGEYGDFGLIMSEEGGANFVNQKVVFTDPAVGDVYFNGECYFVKNKAGSVFVYNLQPYFLRKITPEEAEKIAFSSAYAVTATWLLGNNPNVYYAQGEQFGGCGVVTAHCADIVANTAEFTPENLVAAAKTSRGDILYELKNKFDNDRYWQLFKSRSFEYNEDLSDLIKSDKIKLEKLGMLDKYNEFLNDYPLLFWKDFAGHWRWLQSSKYLLAVECGKPVIYLYPEKETDVKVEVKPNGGFTKTEPMYDNGWFVRATPESELFNYTDKINYPYLFWEGKAYNFVTPNYGFVMSRVEVSTKMTQILAKLGLNEKEIKDFLEFWQPKLEVKPFVFVTFLPQREFDKLAPLSVNPKPDTIIRVFMDYTPLDAPIKVAPMQIRTPERVGFTVVEWGGRLRGN